MNDKNKETAAATTVEKKCCGKVWFDTDRFCGYCGKKLKFKKPS